MDVNTPWSELLSALSINRSIFQCKYTVVWPFECSSLKDTAAWAKLLKMHHTMVIYLEFKGTKTHLKLFGSPYSTKGSSLASYASTTTTADATRRTKTIFIY